MKIRIVYIVLVLLTVFIQSCRDPFEPELRETNLNFLIVEGFIEVEGESKIKLSRSTQVRSTDELEIEIGARVFLTNEEKETWEFQEREAGTYTLTGNFDPSQDYQLGIWLSNGQQYMSEALKPIITPEIEELGYLRDEEGVEIFVSTKGNDEAQYFLWSYEEHWIFRPGVITYLIYDSGLVRSRKEEERIDRCWGKNLFPKIVLQNSSRFEDNTILQRELVRIPNLSEKLTQKYSILVTQRAINQESFDFWEILRKNSDDIGGIFSPLPSLIRSNIKNINDNNEPVIGFISMGKSASKRLFISIEEVIPWPVFIPEYEFCQVLQDTIPPSSDLITSAFSLGDRTPARALYNQMGGLIGYLAAESRCTDCTLRGTNVKPDFWED
ncbi:DUF4249 domain-containing protein [Shivajiella indica]|uniref:DUF4249 domain-containing protein n=1 Tax=Shivajiella indica TaxID=872115 RepID=A0ABW5BA62_9BACT